MTFRKPKFKVGDILNNRDLPCVRVITHCTKERYTIAYMNGATNLFGHAFTESQFYLVLSGGKKVLRFLKLFGHEVEENEV